jgi:Protein of unknown function (DUF1579)
MNMKRLWTPVMLTMVGLTALASSPGFAASDALSAGQEQMQLPPGWTAEDMQAMMAAATPGKMQALLAQDAGTWKCKTTMWMTADSEPIESEGTSTVTPLLDGRYVQIEMSGEMPGMGPYNGLGINGYDNVSKQFVSTWIDNHGTGISNGVGKLSGDGKTLTWEFTANCPITKKPMTMREVDTTTGPNTKTLEMFGTSPKGGPEFKMMSIEMTKD